MTLYYSVNNPLCLHQKGKRHQVKEKPDWAEKRFSEMMMMMMMMSTALVISAGGLNLCRDIFQACLKCVSRLTCNVKMFPRSWVF